MKNADEFDFWRGEYLENPQALESETWRLFEDMCVRGNSYAIGHYEQMKRDWRRAAIERGEIVDTDRPLNTVGNIDAKETDFSFVPSNAGAEYPKNWNEIAIAQKNYRNWRCQVCDFCLQGSGLIQVHHIDRDKSNNDRFNLQVLCAICHGEKHSSLPTWPIGVSQGDMAKLIKYHRDRHFRLRIERVRAAS